MTSFRNFTAGIIINGEAVCHISDTLDIGSENGENPASSMSFLFFACLFCSFLVNRWIFVYSRLIIMYIFCLRMLARHIHNSLNNQHDEHAENTL
jgi:hypothetical protein